MKTGLFLILWLAATTSYAKCSSNGLTVWPSAKTIKQNAVFVVDGFAESQKVVKGLGASYEAYLQSGSQHILLQVKELLIGQYELTQAVLRPVSSLEVGKQYELVIRDKGSKTTIELGTIFRPTKVLYTVAAGTDHLPPSWKVLPHEQTKSYIEMGCGPEIFVDFVGAVQDQSEYLVKASVKNLTSGKVASYYLPLGPDGLIKIGHSMCAGAFSLERAKRFSVVFTLMDTSANITSWVGKPILFTSPSLGS